MICKQILLITGPTASGKTEIALEIAQKLPAEILSVDSRQFYRYMNIGTAKPSPSELAQFKHHFIDIADPDEQISAGEFSRRARAVIAELWRRNIVPILVGGSAMYWKSVIDGLYGAADDAASGMCREIASKIGQSGNDALYHRLGELDPISQFRINKNDTQRLLRAVEVALQGGKTLSEEWREPQGGSWGCLPIMIWLDRDRTSLYRRIDARVDAMIKGGLVEEVDTLIEMGYDASTYTMGSMGYEELLQYRAGHYSLERAVDEIKKNSRHFAKRQTTWLRKDRRLRRLDVDLWGVDGCKERILAQFSEYLGECFYS
jgi:tRNA dimethylallyltransferase